MTTEQRAVEIAEAIMALPDDDDHDAIAALFFAGDGEVFRFMDEKPGSYCFDHLREVIGEGGFRESYGDWHRRLRRTRNDVDCNLFERLAGHA